jgi:hypothetical protein
MKSLRDKLGIKPGMTGWALNCPDALTSELSLPTAPPAEIPDLTIAFVGSAADVAPALRTAQPAYARGKALWFAYPKKTGSIRTDISRDCGWEPLAAAGLLPVTQISIDDTWSALRFRYRDEIKTMTRKSDLPGKRD